jgi:starch synthase
MNKKRVLFASSEVYPFCKTGGLADVSHSLPKALNKSHDVKVVLPLYGSINRNRFKIKQIESFEVMMGGTSYEVELHGTHYEGIEYRFIYSQMLCDREFLYGPPECGYEDNALRFGLFSYAITEILRRDPHPIAHLNDWQCALVPLLVKEDSTIETKSLFTIHNLAYQGVFPPSVLPQIGIDYTYFTMEGIEFYNQVNFMKGAIAYADAVTTVSPTYAKEMLTPEFGCGLEGFLRSHRRKLSGIINGIDSDHFSPSCDEALVEKYTDAKRKKPSKTALLKELSFKGANKPLFAFIGRLTEQKGIDILVEALPKILELECNVVVLGEGEAGYRSSLSTLAERYKNLSLSFGYDEAYSHRVYAGADFVLIPSLFEPCGLNQMIAFAYGAVPVVTRVGGLADTVKKVETYDETSLFGYGILFTSPTPRSLVSAVKKSCELYGDKKYFEAVVNHNMKCDFSWGESAKAYQMIYERLSK